MCLGKSFQPSVLVITVKSLQNCEENEFQILTNSVQFLPSNNFNAFLEQSVVFSRFFGDLKIPDDVFFRKISDADVDAQFFQSLDPVIVRNLKQVNGDVVNVLDTFVVDEPQIFFHQLRVTVQNLCVSLTGLVRIIYQHRFKDR